MEDQQLRTVLKIEIPLPLAPVLNTYSSMPFYQRAKIRKQVDMLISIAKQQWTGWDMGVKRLDSAFVEKGKIRRRSEITGGKKRKVILTRHSSRQPDELSCDVLGGKIPIDRLVRGRVLRDDDSRWLEREAHWKLAKRGQGKVVIEVEELIYEPGKPGA